MSPRRSALYVGRVMHARHSPVRHRFAYRVFMLLLDLDELPDLDRALRLFAHNRRGILSFHDRDHGRTGGPPLRDWLGETLEAAGVDAALGSVALLTLPRVFGYVFNPISIFYCRDSAERLRAIVYEVHNTFGERHAYVIPVDPERNTRVLHQEAGKAFHVSPFIGMDAHYRFRLTEPGPHLALHIDETVDGAPLLKATFNATRRPLTDGALLRALAAHPLVTLKVTLGIHGEALRLWLKGVPMFAHPQTPDARTTAGRTLPPSSRAPSRSVP